MSVTVTDNYSHVKWNTGEQIVTNDLNTEALNSITDVFDKILDSQLFRPNFEYQGDVGMNGETSTPVDGFGNTNVYGYVDNAGQAYFVKGSGNAHVKITPGTLYQFVNTEGAGDGPAMLGIRLAAGQVELTFDNGDAGGPRCDIIEMKLSLIDDDPQTRYIATAPLQAFLDLSTVTTDDNTVVQAIVPGAGGDQISIAFASTGSLTYTENGNAITITYHDGVTTVGAVEALIAADSTLINIKSAGTSATVLHAPGDTFAATHLASGADRAIGDASVDKKQQVEAIFQIKKGVAAATPTVPDPDTGYALIAVMVIPTSYAWGGTWTFNPFQSALPLLMDHRVPTRDFGASLTGPSAMAYKTSLVNLGPQNGQLIGINHNSTGTYVWTDGLTIAPCQCGGRVQRLLAVETSTAMAASRAASLCSWDPSSNAAPNLFGNDGNLVLTLISGPTTAQEMLGGALGVDWAPTGGIAIDTNDWNQGGAIWTNGMCGPTTPYTAATAGSISGDTELLALAMTHMQSGDVVYWARFWTAG